MVGACAVYGAVVTFGSTIGAVLGLSSVPGVLVLVAPALAAWLLVVLSSRAVRPVPPVTLALLAVAVVALGATPFIA